MKRNIFEELHCLPKAQNGKYHLLTIPVDGNPEIKTLTPPPAPDIIKKDCVTGWLSRQNDIACGVCYGGLEDYVIRSAIKREAT